MKSSFIISADRRSSVLDVPGSCPFLWYVLGIFEYVLVIYLPQIYQGSECEVEVFLKQR